MKKLMMLLTAAAIFALAGCGDHTVPPQETDTSPEGTAVIGLASPITGKYFFAGTWGSTGADTDIGELIFGGNTVICGKNETKTHNTGVLKDMDIREEDNGDRTYIFTLKDGLKFSDGSSLTAKDYVFSVLVQSSEAFSRLENADNSRYSHLVGWEEFSSGKSDVFEGVKLISGNQFSLTVDGDRLPYYDEMSMVDVCPLPVSVLAPGCSVTSSGWSGVTAAQLRNTFLGSTGYRLYPTVTAGPYTLTEISGRGDGTVLTLECNPHYAPAENCPSPQIASLQISNADLSVPEEYDLICGISGEDIAAVRTAVTKKGMSDRSYQSGEMGAILFGEEISVGVRHALAALLDPEECVDTLAGRWGEPVVGMNPPAAELTETYRLDLIRDDVVWNDLSLAETLLGGSEPELTLTYDRDDPDAVIMAEYLTDAAQDSGLLTVSLRPVDRSVLVSTQRSGEYELLFFHDEIAVDGMPWEGPEILPDRMLEITENLAGTSGGLDYRYEAKWLEFQNLYLQELPALGLCSYERCDLVVERLSNYGDPSSKSDWTDLILSAYIEE